MFKHCQYTPAVGLAIGADPPQDRCPGTGTSLASDTSRIQAINVLLVGLPKRNSLSTSCTQNFRAVSYDIRIHNNVLWMATMLHQSGVLRVPLIFYGGEIHMSDIVLTLSRE